MDIYLAPYLAMPPHKIKQLYDQLNVFPGSVMVLSLDATLCLICLGTTVLDEEW